METTLKNLIAVQDVLIGVQTSEHNDFVLVQGEATIDLDEFDLRPQEIEKFGKILKKMNAKLAESFQKQFPATSVISEIRSKPYTQFQMTQPLSASS